MVSRAEFFFDRLASNSAPITATSNNKDIISMESQYFWKMYCPKAAGSARPVVSTR